MKINIESIDNNVIMLKIHDKIKDRARKNWYKFSRNKLSVMGLIIVVFILILAIFAPIISPYPRHAGEFVDYQNASAPPSLKHFFGTDIYGRDIFTRILYAYWNALLMGIVVLAIATPVGVLLGLIAGYFRGTWIDTVIMRLTDVFLGVPTLLLAMTIASILEPTLINAMIAATVSWWPWYTRLIYGMTTSIRNEHFVTNAELIGANKTYIIFNEILPNCLSPIFTKMALDVGWVILLSASLSFVGLGEQPPTPALGQMVSEGARYMPEIWWMTVFPSLAIVVIILGFNLMGDGARDMLLKGVRD